MVAAAAQNIKERDYWLKQLSGELVKSHFPVDYPGGGTTVDASPDTYSFRLDGELFVQLMKLSNGFDYSLHMILTAAVLMVLRRYSGNDDIIIGAPIYKQEVEGNFVNTVLALRNRIQPGMTFKDLLLHVKDVLKDAGENQNYPIESLMYQLDIETTPDQFPLFDTAVLLENIHDINYIRHLNLNTLFSFSRTDTHIDGVIEYNGARYHKDTIARIVSHLINFLGIATFNLDQKVNSIDVFSPDEKTQLLEEFNRTDEPFSRELTIHGLFAKQARETPENIAVVMGEEKQSVTYGELDKKSSCLASHLITEGVAPGSIVGLMLERSIDMVTAMLAVLKCGAAYLPIDPGHPADRVAYMMNDSEVKLLLTQEHLRDRVQLDVRVLELNDKSLYEDEGVELPDTAKDVSNLAYIIYTSGSTGKAKGVTVEHRSIVNTLLWRKNYYKFNSSDVVMQVLGYTFDSSVEDIFTTLVSGARLVLIPQDSIYDLNYLKSVVTGNGVTYFLIVPGFYKSFLEEISDGLKGVRAVTVAGDNISEKLVSRHFQLLPGIELYNEYGPTENSVCSTVYRFRPDNPAVLIGKPISNVKCYILINGDQLAPIGVPGELCVSGGGLARGYLKRPELTNEKFVNHPFIPGEKMYRTGDLARWLPDGNIDFLGRIDHQVKIRGFRIELGEIENRLMGNPNIKETLVVAIEEEEKYLCAYFVAESKIDQTELRDLLSQHLPEYMIPAYFVQLEQMPLTLNGKIDRKALPKPDVSGGEGSYTAPRNGIEKKMVDIWSEVLEVEKDRMGIDNNFFDLGGHSLKATVLVSRINKAFDTRIPMAEIFHRSCIRELAEFISEKAGEELYTAITPAKEKEYYVPSSAQNRLYVLQQMEEDNISYNIPIIYILDGQLEKERLENAFRLLIQRHEIFRTSFVPVDDLPMQKIHGEVPFGVSYFQLPPGAGEEREKQVIRDFIRPFDLSRAPLLRAGVIEVTGERHILIADVHHIISDGVSHRLLMEDFMALYENLELEPLKLQYKDYSEWQQSKLDSAESVLKAQEAYWLKQFEGTVPVLNIPTDFPRTKDHDFAGKTYQFELGKENTEGLRKLASEQDVTMHILTFAIFNVLLARKSGQDDLVVGTPVAGRRHADLERIIGLFINTLALRNFPCGDKTFLQFLAEAKEYFLMGFENQDYQFEDLVKRLNVNRDMNRNPLFDFMFELMKFDPGKGEGLGVGSNRLKAAHYELEKTTTKIDQDWLGVEVEDNVYFTVNYSTRLYREETIGLFHREFIILTESILADPNTLIQDLEYRTQTEIQLNNVEDVEFKF